MFLIDQTLLHHLIRVIGEGADYARLITSASPPRILQNGGHNLLPLVQIGLTDIPNLGGGARAPPPSSLLKVYHHSFNPLAPPSLWQIS